MQSIHVAAHKTPDEPNIEALRIATKARVSQYNQANRDCATATQLATIEQQIKDYNDLIAIMK